MEFPIEKKRLFRILNDVADESVDCTWAYAFVYHDDEAVQVLKDLGFVELKSSGKILNNVHELQRIRRSHEVESFVEVHLKSEFLTLFGLALLREEHEE